MLLTYTLHDFYNLWYLTTVTVLLSVTRMYHLQKSTWMMMKL